MKAIILSDFDGTITTKDTLVEILNAFAPSTWHRIEKSVKSGRMGSRVALRKEFSLFYIKRKKYISFLKNNIEIDGTFKPFLKFVRGHKVKIVTLSGGFSVNIRTIFDKYNIRGLSFYANRLLFGKDKFGVIYPYPRDGCRKCGNCKRRHLLKFKRQGYYIIYIGDSTTDRCPIKNADLVFAKWDLAKYCRKRKIPYVSYKNFKDIRNHLIRELPRIRTRITTNNKIKFVAIC